jgi:hypothetical protein
MQSYCIIYLALTVCLVATCIEARGNRGSKKSAKTNSVANTDDSSDRAGKCKYKKLGHHLLICLFPGFFGGSIQGLCILRFAQRQETLDLPYLTLLCDNLKK